MYADYDFYTNQYGGTDIPAEKWPRLADRADAHMDALTFGRLKRGWPTTDAVRMACCAMAELLNGQRTGGALEAAAGVKSEATDGYSVSYGTYAERCV